MSMVPDQMIHIADIPEMIGKRAMPVHRDYDSVLVAAWRFDLDGIGQLQVALDKAVEGIRAYQDRKAADGDA